ncbi:hypothetical protein AMATHDRAFT_49280 [Amanita thiersii Skay4041]|uniref:BHLH domain-containing protein n=1 Tax=Amanita thiersii Skay4041 TaxID=703135 RepID=A0A2A9NKE3_9AGAR|nr:hypothetical protein AMATHDRAFT_49280 [Amanita thiersii Skay4041]
MSFFSAQPYKQPVRQEGFHLPSPAPSSATPPQNHSQPNSANTNTNNFDLFNIGSHHFLPDAFRKFPSATATDNNAMDFDEELASLIGPPPQHQSNERSTQSPIPAPNGHHHAPSGSFDDGTSGSYHHRPQTHNIFDISAPASAQSQVPLASSASSTTSAFSTKFAHMNGNGPNNNATSSSNLNASNGTHSQPSSLHSPTILPDFTPSHTHFNSTLPALNSSMRYEPHPDPPPSCFSHHFTRHTPSPINSSHPHSHSHTQSRSRSRSRPPSGGGAGGATTSGGVGPARTTRSRRNNSISSTSPPPPHGRPQAIVIPGRSGSSSTNSAISPLAATSGGWFISGGHPSTSDYSLSESLHSHPHHHSHSQSLHHPAHNTHQGYTPFSLSSPNNPSSSSNPQPNGNSDAHSMHLPPVSALHPHSLPKTASVLSGADPNHHHHHHHFSPSTSSQGLPGSYNLNGLSGLNGLGGLNSLNVNVSSGLGPGSPVSPTASASLNGGSLNGLGASGLASANGSAAVTVAMTAQEKQQALANEKRRRRRESHNAVERRRRDNINEKISELATLIPECMLDTGTTANNATTPMSPLDEPLLPGSPLDLAASSGVPPPASAAGAVNGSASPKEAKREEVGSDTSVGGGAGGNGGSGGDGASGERGAVVKANKGMILRKSVEYIRYLQQLVTAQGVRNRELEAELKAYRAAAGVLPSPQGSSVDGDGRRDDPMAMAMSKELSPGGQQQQPTPTSPRDLGSDGEMGSMMLHDGSSSPSANTTTTVNGGSQGQSQGSNNRASASYGPFGGMFGLPSMPEGGEDEEDEGGNDPAELGYPDVGGAGGMEGVVESGEDAEERGRTRMKIMALGMGIGKIKEEHDMVAMET